MKMPTHMDITDVTEDMFEDATIAEISKVLNMAKEALKSKQLGSKVRIAQLKQELEELKPRRAKRTVKLSKKQKKAKAAAALTEDSEDE